METIVKSLRIEEELHKQIKVYCVNQGISIQSFIHNTLKEKMEEVNVREPYFKIIPPSGVVLLEAEKGHFLQEKLDRECRELNFVAVGENGKVIEVTPRRRGRPRKKCIDPSKHIIGRAVESMDVNGKHMVKVVLGKQFKNIK